MYVRRNVFLMDGSRQGICIPEPFLTLDIPMCGTKCTYMMTTCWTDGGYDYCII